MTKFKQNRDFFFVALKYLDSMHRINNDIDNNTTKLENDIKLTGLNKTLEKNRRKKIC